MTAISNDDLTIKLEKILNEKKIPTGITSAKDEVLRKERFKRFGQWTRHSGTCL